MPTVDELLNASNEVTTCTINPDTREIIVPEKYKILGVFSDEKVTKIPFTCPKVVGNNVDLTEYNLYINYQNAIGRHNAYSVDDVAVSGDNITFSWLLSRDVTLSSGIVKYSICAKKLNGDSISNEWNTTIANGVVIQGLEATQAIVEENSDIIEAILSKAHTHANKLVLDKFAESNGKPTYDGKDLGGGASTSEGVSYTNAQLPNAANVKTALDELVPKSHSHANKDELDKISVSNGKLQYNGSNVGLKGDKGTNGTTPHIGDNGNWYLGTTDTGKPSRGAKGDPGKNGNDASVTEANITSALGYKPVAPGDIPAVPTAEISANTSARHSHTNKDVLDSITAIDTVMSGTSTNPVQNKVIKKYIDDHSAGTGGTGGTANAVLYTAQTLDLTQQGQARTNIGAIGYNSPQFQGFLSLAPANAPLGTGVGLSPSGSGNDFTLDISDVNEGTPTLLTGVKTPTDSDTNAAATVEYVKSKVAGTGSTDAVLYTAQTLTYAQKKQARANIDAAIADFVVNGIANQSGTVTLDKTLAQINEASNSGKNVLARITLGNFIAFMPLTQYDSGTAKFAVAFNDNRKVCAAELVVTTSANSLSINRSPGLNDNRDMLQISMASDPTEAMQIATKKYVDDHLSGAPITIKLGTGNVATSTATFAEIKAALEAGKAPILDSAPGTSHWFALNWTISGTDRLTIQYGTFNIDGGGVANFTFYNVGVSSTGIQWHQTYFSSSYE